MSGYTSKEQAIQYIKDESKKVNVELSELQAGQFLQYFEMLIGKNKVMNLTRIVDFEDAVKKHFVDSLAITSVIDLRQIHTVLDLGTGAGFPGIPLKIAFPHLEITMIDSVGKKINFVNEVLTELNLISSNLTDLSTMAMHARAEEMAFDKKYRGKFDLCVSRAVANLSTLSEYCLPFVKINGDFISYKSGDSAEEIAAAEKAIKILGGSPVKIRDYSLYDMGRTLVTVKKLRGTPSTYPRKAGTPSKQPIS